MKRTQLLLVTLIAGLSLTSHVNAAYFDGFDSIDSGWVTDRREPAAFTSLFFDGDNRLKITVNGVTEAPPYNSTFYNTQGRQHAATVSGPWSLTGQLYISSDFISGNNLRRADIWGRAGLVGDETGAEYFIFGARRFDVSDPFNIAAANITSVWRVWDADTANGWVELASPVVAGWHDLGMTFTGSSLIYTLDNVAVYTDTTLGGLASNFTTMFAQSYNFGAANGNYDVYFDNINVVAVPEPSSLALVGIGCLAVVNHIRRRR